MLKVTERVFMISDIIRGNESEAIAARTRGWIAGFFMPPGTANTNDLEVKLWRYEKPFDYGKKRFDGTELIVIYGGTLQLDLTDEAGQKSSEVLVGENIEYVVLPPSITKEVSVLLSPAFGITVRWPSQHAG
jgi:hypothetical protein